VLPGAYYAAYGGTPPPRAGASHPTIAPYGPFTAGDGVQMLLGIQNEREWQRFCAQVLERPELAADPRFERNSRRVANREALDAAIGDVFAALSGEEVLARLERAQIANSRMSSMHEFWEHPQFAARDRWRTVGSPAGPLQAPLPPASFAGMEPRMDPIPALGEHTDAILRGIGYTEEEIAALRGEGAI
jgi:itaconate CoA-transferase